jgi:hypothetical protein
MRCWRSKRLWRRDGSEDFAARQQSDLVAQPRSYAHKTARVADRPFVQSWVFALAPDVR